MYNPLLIEKLEQVLKKDPNSKSFCTLAHIYRSLGKLKKAEELCLEGLTHHPYYYQAYILLGEIYKEKKQMKQALKSFNQARKLNPDNPGVYKHLGEIYSQQKDIEKTFNAYKTALLLEPTNKTVITIVQHLEAVLNKDLRPKKKTQPLFFKTLKKLIKLNKIQARIENYIMDKNA